VAEDDNLKGRTALVTGSVGGLGYHMACGLADAGANVMFCDLHAPEDCHQELENALEMYGERVAYQRADLSDAVAVQHVVEQTVSRFGSLEILVNNAVVRHFAPIEVLALDDWNRAVSVNLTAAFVATKLALPIMRQAGYGRIFNMTSVFGLRATINRADYITTKAALQGLTRATAIEVARDPISCHGLTPGSVHTPGTQLRIEQLAQSAGISQREAEARFLDGKQPNGRFVDPGSIVTVMLMLCGSAGQDMNGAIMPIEGGWLSRS
jgi:3-hydroxybutyrate dehydrogenase